MKASSGLLGELYTLYSILYTLYFTLHPTPYTLHSTLYTLHSTLYYTLYYTVIPTCSGRLFTRAKVESAHLLLPPDARVHGQERH